MRSESHNVIFYSFFNVRVKDSSITIYTMIQSFKFPCAR